jgi:hypothetical protein
MMQSEVSAAPPRSRGEQALKIDGAGQAAEHGGQGREKCGWSATGRCAGLRSDLGQALAAFGAACIQHDTPTTGLHADKKSMRARTAGLRGLVGTLHGSARQIRGCFRGRSSATRKTPDDNKKAFGFSHLHGNFGSIRVAARP